MQSGKVVVQSLYKVFGQQPQEAIDLLKQGWSKEKVLAERGAVPGIIATVIFAMPPAVRLTALGIRQVNREIVEAGQSFGDRITESFGTRQNSTRGGVIGWLSARVSSKRNKQHLTFIPSLGVNDE